jgi:methylglutaconyl-CoA hydratase
MSAPGCRIETEDGVTTITIDVPERANAISEDLATRMVGALDAATADDHVRAVVITATGTTFCSGADLRERSGPGTRGASAGNIALYTAILRAPKPVVARINGHVRAGGLALVAATDIAICSDRATFGAPEVHLGLVPAVVSVSLQRQLSPRGLQRYLLTGETFDPAEAERIGLVTKAVPLRHLDAEMAAVLRGIRRAGPGAVGPTKALLAEIAGQDIDALYRERSELSTRYYRTDDALEGMKAFLEKRPPRWVTSG